MASFWIQINKRKILNVFSITKVKKQNHTGYLMPFVAAWMDLEIVIPSEVSQTQKDKYHMIPLIIGI